ncbi:hypothetical protein LP420_32800 [Massilia sp. B-10]|nr:hypothetical protein LP420_32800 [Massilia sp. B-10]
MEIDFDFMRAIDAIPLALPHVKRIVVVADATPRGKEWLDAVRYRAPVRGAYRVPSSGTASRSPSCISARGRSGPTPQSTCSPPMPTPAARPACPRWWRAPWPPARACRCLPMSTR